MGTLDGFNVEVYPSILFADGGVFGIGKGAGGAVAYACGGVGVFAELACVAVGTLGLCEGGFVGAELVVDHLPYHFIVLHDGIIMRLLYRSCNLKVCRSWLLTRGR